VIASGGNPRSAYWGALFSAAAKGRGASGLVCDSYTRDRTKVLALDFPVFCTGTKPVDYRARMCVVAAQEPVLCGGVAIQPGDVVLADDDGVVAVPGDHADSVLDRATARASTESDALADLLAGTTLREVWQRYRVL
jgi:regulator of RNase E activity RraA